MQARSALIAAIVCGGLAVAAVSLDLAYTLTLALETRDQSGDWITMAVFPYEESTFRAQPAFGCAGPMMRVVVDNNRPFGASENVRAWYFDSGAGRSVEVLDETWTLDAGERRTHEFTIPPGAFPTSNATDEPYRPDGGEVQAAASIGRDEIGTCVRAAGPDEGIKGATA